MVRSDGKRSNTRHLFRRAFRKHGPEHTSTYLQTFKVGEYVDIAANASEQKGMPHKYYHGKTAQIFNVSRRAVGVEVMKAVGNRYIPKRFHLRIEHVRKSRCREDFKKFIKQRDAKRREAKAKGEKQIDQKRKPVGPVEPKIVDANNMELLQPLKYEFIV
mmetsp:Transcript_578/g.1022  ORF Transcript_578/g.1022 Transcript_578/m.1022 type:complete len:160 (-) Transcript_578:223-702(-)